MNSKSPARFVLFCVCLVAIIVVGSSIIYRFLTPTIYSTASSSQELEFPNLENTSISKDVKTLLNLAKLEYNNPQPGEAYAGGTWEPWCADFVSYLYKEAGHPFQNPNTGSWRIPGIYTLREYLQANNAWHPEADYHPEPGDIVVYDGGLFGGHTNIVVQVDADYLITIGGNENNQIRLEKFQWQDSKYGVRGFGHLLD